jgi:hypothetical protein
MHRAIARASALPFPALLGLIGARTVAQTAR